MNQSNASQIFVGVTIAAIVAVVTYIVGWLNNSDQYLYYLNGNTTQEVKIESSKNNNKNIEKIFVANARIFNLGNEVVSDVKIAFDTDCPKTDIIDIKLTNTDGVILNNDVSIEDFRQDGSITLEFSKISLYADFSVFFISKSYCNTSDASSNSKNIRVDHLSMVRPKTHFFPDWFLVFSGISVGFLAALILVHYGFIVKG